jgi:hypothetical protein
MMQGFEFHAYQSKNKYSVSLETIQNKKSKK